MKKQIISVLLLISLLFQSTRSFPFATPAQQKKYDSIPWWRIRKLYKAAHEADRKLHACGGLRCKQEKEELDKIRAEWKKISLRRSQRRGWA